MSTPSLSSPAARPLKSFCCCQRGVYSAPSREYAEQFLRKLDRVLARGVLCPHAPEQLLLIHRNLEQIEQSQLSNPEGRISSSQIVEKVQGAIGALLSIPGEHASPCDLINLYYLSRFSPVAPTGIPVTKNILEQRQNKGGNFAPELIAKQLPHCISKGHFLDDLHELTGLEKKKLPTVVQRPFKILELDTGLRKRRRLFLERRGCADYPAYLDQLLEGGFLYLYDYLLSSAESIDEGGYRKEIWQFDAPILSGIILDVRHAIVKRVKNLVKKGHPNVVFLVGNTGAGKSTTVALLQGDRLERKGRHYEAPDHNTTGRSLTTSSTFLPNVRCGPDSVYVDFPGFNDTHGEPINLGIELAFKSLVVRYRPKIVIVDSVKALEAGKGSHVKELGKKLKRMLGKEAPCSVFLTQYLQLSDYVRLESQREREKKLDVQIKKLSSAISQREKVIAMLEQKVARLNVKSQDQTQDANQQIRELREEIEGLEEKKLRGTLTKCGERRFAACRKELAELEEELQQRGKGKVYSQEQQQLEAKLEKKRKRNEKDRIESDEKSEKLDSCRREIDQANENIRKKTHALLRQLGIATVTPANFPEESKKAVTSTLFDFPEEAELPEKTSDESHVAELCDLQDPKALNAAREVLDKAKPIKAALKEISDRYRGPLIDRFEQALTGGELPLPPSLKMDDLHHRILETSLTAALTAEHFPEIGEFFHLSEMEPECVEELDQRIISKFSEALIQLIILGPSGTESVKDSVSDFIEKQIKDLGKKQEKEEWQLKAKWDTLKQRVLDSTKTGAVDWSELEEYYQRRRATSLKETEERKKQNIDEWKEWVAGFFGLKGVVGLPKSFHEGRAKQEAHGITKRAIEDMIDGLNRSFDKLRELQKIVENKRAVEKQWQRCSRALVEDPANFPREIRAAIDQARQVYDQGAKIEETWASRTEEMAYSVPQQFNFLCFRGFTGAGIEKLVCSGFANLMFASLCYQRKSNNTRSATILNFTLPKARGLLEGCSRIGTELNAAWQEAQPDFERSKELAAQLKEQGEELLKLVPESIPASQLGQFLEVALTDLFGNSSENSKKESPNFSELGIAKSPLMAVPMTIWELSALKEQLEPMLKSFLTNQAQEIGMPGKELKRLLGIESRLLGLLVRLLKITKSLEDFESRLGLKSSGKESFLNRVGNVNYVLARRLSLNLTLNLHKMLFIDTIRIVCSLQKCCPPNPWFGGPSIEKIF